ncbi:uncharacterized protein LOC135370461 [Ornithodoros turicata]|uniref:uncharacterized protein LOC135370461 n=1 Tax=Ornithodoros turicata TaxID=34597 RepID=UPI00313935C8
MATPPPPPVPSRPCVTDQERLVSRTSSATKDTVYGEPYAAHEEIQAQKSTETTPFYDLEGFIVTPERHCAPQYPIASIIDAESGEPIAQQLSSTAPVSAYMSPRKPDSVNRHHVYPGYVARRHTVSPSAALLSERITASTATGHLGRSVGPDMTISRIPRSETSEMFDREMRQKFHWVPEASGRAARRADDRRRQQHSYEQQFERQCRQYKPRHQWLQPQHSRCRSNGEEFRKHAIPPGEPAGRVEAVASDRVRGMDDVKRDNVLPDLSRDRGGVPAEVTERPASFSGLGARMGVALQRHDRLTSTRAALQSIAGMLQGSISKPRQWSVGDTLRLVPAGNGDAVIAYVLDVIADEVVLEDDRKKRRKKRKKKKKKRKKKKKKKKRRKKKKKKKKKRKKGKKRRKKKRKKKKRKSKKKKKKSKRKKKKSKKKSKEGEGESAPTTTALSSTSTPSTTTTTTSTKKPTEKVRDTKTAPPKPDLKSLTSQPSLSMISPTSMQPTVWARTSVRTLTSTGSQCTKCGAMMSPSDVDPFPARGFPPQRRPQPSRSAGWGSRGRSPSPRSPQPPVEDDWPSAEESPEPRRPRSRSSSRRHRRSRSSRRHSRSHSSRRCHKRCYCSSTSESSSSDDCFRRRRSRSRRPAMLYGIDLPLRPPIDPLERYYTEPDILGRVASPMYAGPLSGPWGRPGSYPFRKGRSYEVGPPRLPRFIDGYDDRTVSNVQGPMVIESEVAVVPRRPLHDAGAQTVPEPTSAAVQCSFFPQVTQPPFMPPQPPQMPMATMATTALPVVQPSPMSLGQLPIPTTPMYSQSPPITPYASSAPLLGNPAWNPFLYPNATSSGTFSTDDTWVKTTVETQPSSSSSIFAGASPMGMYAKQPNDPWWSPYGYMKRMDQQQGNVIITFIFLLGVVACVVAILSRFGAGRAPIVHESMGYDDDESRVMHGPWINKTGGGTRMEPYGLCRTLECRREGLYLSRLVDSAGACRNFYDYVCARTWGKPDNGELSSADLMVNGVESSIISYIKAGHVKDSILREARNLWKECMDVDTIRKLGKKPFTEVLNKVGLNGWPYGSAANVTGKSVWNVSGTLMRLLSLGTFLTLVVEPTATNSTALVIIRKGPVQTSAYLHDNDTINELFRKIKERVSLLDAENEIDEIVNDIVTFSRTISNLSDSESEKVTSDNHTEFQSFISSALSGILDLSDGSVIHIHDAGNVQELYQTIQSAPVRTVLNYLGYAVVDNLWLFSPQENLSSEQTRAREHECIRVVERALPKQVHYLAYLATKHHLDVAFFSGLAHDIKHQVIRSIRVLSWMDASTKAHVLKYLSSMRIRTFFPQWMINNHTRPEVSHPSLPPLQVLVSYQQIMQNTFEESIMGRVNNEEDFWMGSVFDQGCRHDEKRNLLFLPLSMANTTKGATQLFLYFHIPHVGVQLAKCLLETIVSSKHADVRKLANIHNCFEDPHFSGTVPVQHPSKRTSVTASDIFEHAAIAQAHGIFTNGIRTLNKNFQDYRFENARNLSAEQLFYIYYASGKCRTYDANYQTSATLQHRSAQLVNLVVSHDGLFHKAFNCRENTSMNPIRKCQFWTR